MNKRSVLVLAAMFGLLAAGLAYQAYLNQQTVSDHDQILALLEIARNAVERTDPRGTMAVVSRDYKDSAGLTYPLLRLRVADALRSGVQPDVIIENPIVDVTGQDARVDLHVRVADRRENDATIINSDFTLLLQKEKLRRHLIFSTQQWQVVSVDGLRSVIESY